MATVTALYRYPVKGLSGEVLARIDLTAGLGMPLDRRWAVARSADIFDPAQPKAQSKTRFLMLMKDERLAQLTTRYDDASGVLTVDGPQGLSERFDLSAASGRERLAARLKSHLELPDLEPVVVSAEGHKFTDISVVSPDKMNAISLINLASVRALEEAIGKPVDPLRFRANIYFDSAAPWEEFDWIDRKIRIGGAVAKVTMRTRRCPATEVDPVTARRDMDVPGELSRRFGHSDMGVYAEIVEHGGVSVGGDLGVLGV